ncbi:GIY-YIG nuclease family protein [Sphingobacterium psychroaquaticum]|uniref:GIY-YIG nuclease family protein n=1 Tax=Sphingobacterium psychroaquaticum TaxID=561061 RepID=UPI00106CEDD9|nr:GIY-YIG nuclease family protein [Sphingobacterium psychroaquaticum]QBQ41703.1 GIY-YIG nuclease family protein [Sphingobacterium psychroaquaticum]
MERGGCIYIMTDINRGTLYIGVTSDLLFRVREHRTKAYQKSFTSRYNLTVCVYYEFYSSIEEAINREKELKGWRREKKNKLINESNPSWNDLWQDIENW